jgi:hypothetical protein
MQCSTRHCSWFRQETGAPWRAGCPRTSPVTDAHEEQGPFLAWVQALEEITEDDVPVLQAVGFLGVSLRLSADAAFAVLRSEAHAEGMDLREVALEVITFRRTIAEAQQ